LLISFKLSTIIANFKKCSEYCFVFIAVISDRNKEMTSLSAMSLV